MNASGSLASQQTFLAVVLLSPFAFRCFCLFFLNCFTLFLTVCLPAFLAFCLFALFVFVPFGPLGFLLTVFCVLSQVLQYIRCAQ